MKNKKGYIFTIFLIFLSLVASVFAGTMLGNKENVPQNDSKIVKNKSDNNYIKRKDRKKGFKRNTKIDEIVAKEPVGKNADIVGEKLTSINTIIPSKLKDGVYQGSAIGYEGPITVEVVIKDSKIISINVISHNETSGYYQKGFKVIDRILASQSPNVDSISGATITSRAIMVATSRALQNAFISDTNNTDVSNNLFVNIPDTPIVKRDKPINNLAYAYEEKFENVNIDMLSVKDGSYSAQVQGFNGLNTVKFTVKNNKIDDIDIVTEDDVNEYFTEDKIQILKNALKRDVNIRRKRDIDGLSGATYSSNSIIRGVKKL